LSICQAHRVHLQMDTCVWHKYRQNALTLPFPASPVSMPCRRRRGRRGKRQQPRLERFGPGWRWARGYGRGGARAGGRGAALVGRRAVAKETEVHPTHARAIVRVQGEQVESLGEKKKKGKLYAFQQKVYVQIYIIKTQQQNKHKNNNQL
jgi:hypothetical protein